MPGPLEGIQVLDFSELLPRLQPAQGLVDIAHRELAVDHRHDAVPLHKGQQIAEL